MSIRFRLLLFLPILVALAVGGFGVFTLKEIHRNLMRTQRIRIQEATLTVHRFFTEYGSSIQDSVVDKALELSKLKNPIVEAATLLSEREMDSLDFAVLAGTSTFGSWSREGWLDGVNWEEVDWSFTLGKAQMGDVGWAYKELGGEPVLIGYAPVVQPDPNNEGEFLVLGAFGMGVRLRTRVLPESHNYVEGVDVGMIEEKETGMTLLFRHSEYSELMSEEEMKQWVRGEVMNQGNWSFFSTDRLVVQGFPLKSEEGIVGGVLLVGDLKEALSTFAQLQSNLVTVLLVWVAIALLTALQVGRSIANPLYDLAHAVHLLEPGGTTPDLHTDRKDEMGQLGRAVQSMHERINRQLTQMEELNSEVQSSYEAKSRFLSTMSHELRTPLNAIIGMADVLTEPHWGKLTEDQREFVDTIKSSANHLLSLINDLLDLSRAEAGKLVAKGAIVVVEEVFQLVVSEQLVLARKEKVTIEAECETGLSVFCDPRHFRQILTNLLNNSIKYNRPGGIVKLVATSGLDGESVLVEVSDTGIGISETEQPNVFKAFTRAQASDSSAISGTGLGLALVSQLTQLNGGHILLQSTSGEGTVFHLVLPALPPLMES